MPFYHIADMEDVQDLYNTTRHKQVTGELMKVGIVTLRAGEEPEPHYHPNEEQFDLVLEGRARMVLGDETRVIERGDIVHIPRSVVHGRKVLEAPLVFLNCKSPVGSGELSLDYNPAPNAAEVKERLARD